MVTKHELKVCPRCGATFECKANRPSQCACAAILIPERVLDELQLRYSDCLCVRCLVEIVGGPAPPDRSVSG
ncbi:MAG: cysteine-rich CWC family protein [Thiocapsa sp.]|nr:cysteine-rich CWC family protein [Thiocapsa sp.]MCG6983866.1 cysteine-rich CWC family protein [Thiocapsa sp.]